MKYFQVEREELRGSIMAGECYSDGEYSEEAHERDNEYQKRTKRNCKTIRLKGKL